MRLRAGRNEDDFSFQLTCALSVGNGHCVGGNKGGLAAYEFDAVECEVLQNALALHVHDFALVMHEIVNGEIFLEGIIDPVKAALLQAGEVQC